MGFREKMSDYIEGKPYYFWLKIDRYDHPIRKEMSPRDVIKKTTIIEYKLEVESQSYLHIGNGLPRIHGYTSKDENVPLKTEDYALDFIRDPDGKPIIPGASLKGYIRNNFETLVKGSCFLGFRFPDQPAQCDSRERRLCPACDLFGINEIMSRIIVSDAKVDNFSNQQEQVIKIPQLTSPREEKYEKGCKKAYINITYDAKHGTPRNPIWVVKPGVVFSGNIHILNPIENEPAQVINAAFNYLGKGIAVLGYGKNIGLGRCKLVYLKVVEKTDPFSSSSDIKEYNRDQIKSAEIFAENSIPSSAFRWNLVEILHKSKGKPFPE